MGARFRQAGTFLDHTPDADVPCGTIIKLGDNLGVGVADHDIPAGRLGALRIAGVYLVDNPDSVDFTADDKVGYDATAGKATASGGGTFDIGTAIYSTDGAVMVLLNNRNS